MKDHLYYLVDMNVAIPLRNPFKVQKKLMETTNFVPDILPNHSGENIMKNTNRIFSKGEMWMPELDFLMENDSISRMKSAFSPSESFLRLMDDTDEDKDDEDDWDEDDDEFDEDEDEDDEEWDEDDEDWDEDEDWDDEDADDEDDEDWEE